jgi:recombination DNA repair RAD52 pathway protein
MEAPIRISQAELSKVENNCLNLNQLKYLLAKTPKAYIKTRPAKGGGTWNYVDGAYVKKVLNLLFGWNWSFEIEEQMIMHGEAIVKGKLTCVSNGVSIVKMQYGNKDIMFK